MLLDALSVTVIACCTLVFTRCIRIVSRLVVGFGILDTYTSAVALVFCAGRLADALVFDPVLCGVAVGGTLVGVDMMFCLHFTTFLDWIGNCACVGGTL